MLPKIQNNVPLKSFSTFGIGGYAEYFVKVSSLDDLKEAILWAKNRGIPYKILAGGSNIVFPDGVLRGLLIKLEATKSKNENVGTMRPHSATPLQEVVDYANKNGLAGLETLAGIPGTLGGAVVGNAGAYGRSISEAVESVETLDPETLKIFWLTNKECEFGYRESIFKKKPLIVLSVKLKLKKGDPKALQDKSREIIAIREKKYKPGLKCPGSFFKNVLVKNLTPASLSKIDKSKIIEGKVPTGYLLEAVGAKGMKVGGIKIADFHGNLFINTGNGTALDVKTLAEELKNRVKNNFGVNIEEEIRYFNND